MTAFPETERDLPAVEGGGRRLGAASQPVGILRRVFYGFVPAVAILLCWHAALEWGPSYIKSFLPPPIEVVKEFARLLANGELIEHTATSIIRVFIGLALAIAVGVPVGLVLGVSKTGEQILGPTFEFLRPIPIAAWVPLSIMLFGIGEAPARALIFLGALYPIILNTRDGVRSVEAIHIRAAQMLGANRLQTIMRVIIPSALPNIITGIRLALGIGWWVVILAELLAVRSGIGYMMVEAQQGWNTETIIVGMVVIGAIGVVLNRMAAAVERQLLRWRGD